MKNLPKRKIIKIQGAVPYGYQRGGEEDPAEQAIIRRARLLAAEGFAIDVIAKAISLGAKNRNGGSFNGTQIRRLLDGPASRTGLVEVVTVTLRLRPKLFEQLQAAAGTVPLATWCSRVLAQSLKPKPTAVPITPTPPLVEAAPVAAAFDPNALALALGQAVVIEPAAPNEEEEINALEILETEVAPQPQPEKPLVPKRPRRVIEEEPPTSPASPAALADVSNDTGDCPHCYYPLPKHTADCPDRPRVIVREPAGEEPAPPRAVQDAMVKLRGRFES